jgi:hypothetical protein
VAAHGVSLWAVFGLRNEKANPIAEMAMIRSGKDTSVKLSRAEGHVTGCPTIWAGQEPLVVRPRYSKPNPKSSPITEKNRTSRLLNFRLSFRLSTPFMSSSVRHSGRLDSGVGSKIQPTTSLLE